MDHFSELNGKQCQLFTSVDGEKGAALILNPDYLAERKIDGKRILLHATGREVVAYNRRGLECAISRPVTDNARNFAQKAGSFLLDGELVGHSYHAFDLLEHEGRNLRDHTAKVRQDALSDLLKHRPSAILPVETAWTKKDKIRLLKKLLADNAEGIVFKPIDAVHRNGRLPDHFKYKFTVDASFIVTGFNEKNSVAVGLFGTRGELVDCGNVTIRNDRFKQRLKLNAIVDCRYLHAFPGSNHIYQPRMIRLRDDLTPSDCLLSQLKYKNDKAQH